MSPQRRSTDTATAHFSWSRLFQGLLLAGILWLIRSVNAQNETLIDLKARFDAVTLNADQVPDLQKAVGRLDVRISNNERRLDALESRGTRGAMP